MTIGYNGRVGYASPNFFGGKSKDALVDAGYGALPTGWSHTDVGTQPCVSVLIDGAHATGPVRGLMTNLSSGATYGLLGWFNLSGTPSLAFCLAGYAADGARCLECGTDGKVRLVKLGNAPNRWSGRTAVSGWSSAALPLTGNTFKHVAWFMDAATLGLSHCWMTLMIDEVEQWSLDIGAMPTDTENTYFELCPDIDDVNAAISVRMYDCAGLLGATTDAPHLVAWPKPKVTAQHPIDDYADVWTGVGSLTDLYKNWDDAAGNDGDTTYNWTNTTDKQQVGHGQTAATIGIDADTIIRSYFVATEGPVANIVHRTASGGTKWAGYLYTGLSALVSLVNPGTTYLGVNTAITRSSGSWAIADVDAIRFGLQTAAADHDYEWRATSIMLQWLTYLTTLPLTTTPTLPAGGFVQTGMF